MKKEKRPNQPTKSERKQAQIQQQYASRGALICGVFLIIVMGFMPLVLGPGRYYTIHVAKLRTLNTAFLFLSVALFISWLMGAVNKQKLRYREGSLLSTFTAAEWPLMAFALIATVSCIASFFGPYWNTTNLVGLPKREDGLMQLLVYVMFYLLLCRAYRPASWHVVPYAIGASCVSLIALAQWLGINLFALVPKDLGNSAIDILFMSTLGNVNIVSTFSAVATAFFVGAFVKSQKKWAALYLAVGCLTAFTLMIVNSDSGIVGLFAALALCTPIVLTDARTVTRYFISLACIAVVIFLNDLLGSTLSYGFKRPPFPYMLPAAAFFAACAAIAHFFTQKWKPLLWRMLTLSVIVVVLVGGLAFVYTSKAEAGNLAEFRNILHGNLSDDAGSYRGYIWKNGITLISDSPFIGTGPDTFGSRMVSSFGAESSQRYGVVFDKAHNEYLQYLINYGALGLLAYLAFIGASFYLFLRTKNPHPYAAGAFLAGLTYVLQAIFTFSHVFTSPYFWALMGILGALTLPARVKRVVPLPEAHEA